MTPNDQISAYALKTVYLHAIRHPPHDLRSHGDDGPESGMLDVVVGHDHLGKPEISQLVNAVVNQDVLRLQVPVDNIVLVKLLTRLANKYRKPEDQLLENTDSLLLAKPFLTHDLALQSPIVAVLDDHDFETLVFVDLVALQHVLAVACHHQFRLRL